jgi:hypothetical protein
MKNINRAIWFLMLIFVLGAISVQAQKKHIPAPKTTKAPDYKITHIKVVPYSEDTGEFGAELVDGTEGEFFNRLDVGLFVTFEISGSKDSFEAGRKIQVTVLEGKSVKLSKLMQVGYMGDNAKTFYGVWLAPSMCSDVIIKASLTGQKTVSKMSKKIPFLCGE